MDRKRICELKNNFDIVLHSIAEENVEYWLARDLMPLLGYVRWENFEAAIQRAKVACHNAGVDEQDQFRDVTKLIEHGKGGKRSVIFFMTVKKLVFLPIFQQNNLTKQRFSGFSAVKK